MDLDLSPVVDALPALVWIAAAATGRVVFLNRHWRDYTGLGPDESNGDGWLSAIHPDDLPMVRERWRSSFANGNAVDIEARIRGFDGGYRWFAVSGRPLSDERGRIQQWCGVGIDIEARKRAEETSRTHDLDLHRIVDSIPGFVAVMAGDGQREHVNAPLLEFFGKTTQDVNEWDVREVVHPEDIPHVVQEWTDAQTSGRSYEIECRYLRADGVYRWCRTRGFPLRDGEGRVVRWFILITDIDDRKRAEMLLAGEKHLLEMVARGQSLTATLEELCRVVESNVSGCRCSVFVVSADGARLEQAVSPTMPQTFLDNVVRTPIEYASNPSAMACSRNEQVVVADAATETRWGSVWRPIALANGVRACCATPFSSATGKVLGAFTLYYDEPQMPAALSQRLIDQFTHIASIAVERARSDVALITSEARKAAVVDSALDSIVSIDHEGRIVEFNPAAEQTFGYGRDEVIGKPLADVLVPQGWQEHFRNGFVHYLASVDPQLLGRRVERIARRADGSEFPIEIAVTRIATDGPPMFTGFLRDITERKRAIEERDWAETRLAGEKRLLEMIASGRHLQDVLDALCIFVEQAAPDCVCAVHLIDWSRRIFHDGAAPSLGFGYIEALHGLPASGGIGPCADAAVTNSQVISQDLHDELRWKGTPFDMLRAQLGLRAVWSTPIYALDGVVLGTFAMYQRKPATPSPRERELIAQVTHIASIAIEKAAAESALKRSEALLGEGERLSLTGTFWWRVPTGEIRWSEQVYRIFDFERDVPVTLDLIATRLHPEDIPVFQEVVERARADESDFEYEVRLLMFDGTIKYVHVVAHISPDREHGLEYIGAIHDVTERRLSEEALSKVRSELAHVARVSMLGTLTASIAHEVNQPLSGIVTNASTCLRMLDADPPNIDGARETTQRAIRDSHRASEVIARLRALFSNRRGAIESVDLNEATLEVIALSRSELRRKRVILQPELADDLPEIRGDRVQLQQVILNLLLNASDAMISVDDRPRQAVITTERDADGVRFTVRDTGEGLKSLPADKIFEPFFTTKADGMGIGLAVSRSIIESHQGRIWATSNDGPGATVAFSLPNCVGETPRRGH